MLISVFNYDTNQYDYFESSEHKSELGMVFGKMRNPKGWQHSVGSSPESLGVTVPPNAKYAGSGAEPKGLIGSPSTGPTLGRMDLMTMSPFVLLAGAAVLFLGIKKFL